MHEYAVDLSELESSELHLHTYYHSYADRVYTIDRNKRRCLWEMKIIHNPDQTISTLRYEIELIMLLRVHTDSIVAVPLDIQQ
jgi:hypothetical protein